MSTDYLPPKDKDFQYWVIVFLNYLFNALQRLGFPNEVYNTLAGMRDDFGGKLDVAENPATRTKLTVQAKNTVRTALKAAIRQAVNEYLTHNHAVTDEDRDGLGIPIHKTTRTPSPKATTYPVGKADTSMLRRVTIHFADQHATEETAKAKPAGQHGVEILWAIRDMPPALLKELTNSSFDTHTPFTLEFEEDERGKTIYFCLCWENTRGEKGPWSPIGSAVIP